MADMKIAENVEPLKKRDKLVRRNANGQFERGSKALAGAGRPALRSGLGVITMPALKNPGRFDRRGSDLIKKTADIERDRNGRFEGHS